ncbi:uncharacterized protein LOC113206745 [Frankliniella occidentalis]|uniref:Uncharacterized protein LOC113206745 n=1 Tax=Frankliniella occidentalis TaxID=133901 RepID=A0A6J1SJN7_FRAOC|nr:uncharacterized protein LOC113206745 [Frankliniella occidentalis]XP_026278756.1 uncharacterized protein LOC113206745 [Frankliniella occidentalis]
MEHLPDDVLVAVMQYLGVQDLFACRLTCKRLASLVLHRDVWRVKDISDSEGCVCPVLHLAPCLRRLSVCFPKTRCRDAYTSTRCAVAELKISFRKKSGAMHATAVICRQEALGRLKNIGILLDKKTADLAADADESILLRTLASTSGLVGLLVFGISLPTTAQAMMGITVSTPSLQRFVCDLCPNSEHFVNFILAGHASTLESVALTCSAGVAGLTSTAPLLASLPNLRVLQSWHLVGMGAVAACEKLNELRIFVSSRREDEPVEGAADLLRRAKHLKKVQLSYFPPARSAEDIGVDLVTVLAAGRSRSHLESLCIENSQLRSNEHHFPQREALLHALPSLSALVHLKVLAVVDPDELLLAIRPDMVPALQHIGVRLPREKCAHAWIHSHTARAVLKVNPSIHVKLDALTPACSLQTCQACVLGCHEVMKSRNPDKYKKYKLTSFTVFSHDPMDKCAQSHTVVNENTLWIHIPVV